MVPDELKEYYREEARFEDVQTLISCYYEGWYDVQPVLNEYDWWEVLLSKCIHSL
jgi:adenosine deaminase